MHYRRAFFFVIGMTAGFAAAQESPATKTFDLTASRFRYTPDTIEVDEGDHVVVQLHSTDVEHGFGIKELGVKTIVPASGEIVTVEFVARPAGTFEFACTEYCGKGHPDMAGKLIVRPAGGGAAPDHTRQRLVDPAEPDVTIVTMPTTAELPEHRLAFRVTHRFARRLGDGSFGDLAGDLFALDSGAQVGLGLRYAPLRGTQLGLYRTSERTIELFAQQTLARQSDTLPLGLTLVVSVEGQDNFGLSAAPLDQTTHYAPQAALVVSRKLGTHGALYVEPSWIGNTNLQDDSDSNTLQLGLGARLRLHGKMYLVGEVAPRIAGYRPLRHDGSTSATFASFGFEHQVGGHVFQINFSNAIGTTPAQVARAQAGASGNDWFLGFGISRKFY